MLRSMLTHPDAGKEVRAAIAEQQRQVAAALPADDAVLRAGLIGALTIGALVSRHLLELKGVRDAEVTEIVSVLRGRRPCRAGGERGERVPVELGRDRQNDGDHVHGPTRHKIHQRAGAEQEWETVPW
jgi:hypothetical protein